MDKLTWFKFNPANWVMGKIQKCPEITQARFMRLLCLYWNKECKLSYEDAEIEVDKEHLDIMISKKVIKIDNDFIVIDFLNDQLSDIIETSEKRRKAVNERWKKTNTKEIENDTSVLQKNTSVLQSDTDKRREDKIREDKSINKRKVKEKTFTPPTLLEVKAYFDEKGYTEQSAIKAFEYYDVAGWKDSKGNKIKSWKQKMIGVWLKPENKKQQPHQRQRITL